MSSHQGETTGRLVEKAVGSCCQWVPSRCPGTGLGTLSVSGTSSQREELGTDDSRTGSNRLGRVAPAHRCVFLASAVSSQISYQFLSWPLLTLSQEGGGFWGQQFQLN